MWYSIFLFEVINIYFFCEGLVIGVCYMYVFLYDEKSVGGKDDKVFVIMR